MKYLFLLIAILGSTITHGAAWIPGPTIGTFTITKAVKPMKNASGSMNVTINSDGTFTGVERFITSKSVKFAIKGKIKSNGLVSWSGGVGYKTNQVVGGGTVTFTGFLELMTIKNQKAKVAIKIL